MSRGWFRLWVVASGLWICAAAFVTSTVDATVVLLGYRPAPASITGADPGSVIDVPVREMTPEEVAKLPEWVRNYGRTDEDSDKEEARRHLEDFAKLSLAGAGGLYIMGWSIGWVIRGFRT